MAVRLDASARDFPSRFAAFLGKKRDGEEDVSRVVRDILAEVRKKGDTAVIGFTERFDRFRIAAEDFRVSGAEIAAAVENADPKLDAALRFAASRIEAYHQRQIPQDGSHTDDTGATTGWRWRALVSVGIYVPGGTASYPSSVLMNAIPARVAGVKRVAMVTPASDGMLDPNILLAAHIASVDEIYRIGGAQAIAALAYGTESIKAVDKIVGPGNAYVAAAKREVFGRVGIDAIAGPSEILVVADGANDPAWIAADLLSQAEHDISSQAVLISDDALFADRVTAEVERQVVGLKRCEIAAASWRDHGAVIVVKTIGDAAELIDAIAPEHLEIATENPGALLDKVNHAGAVFLGRHTPEAIGDYVAGSNHVLPTSRTARFSSGLSVLDFMKRTSVLSCDAEALAALGPSALALAEAEGFSAHGRSIAIRMNPKS